MRGTLAEHPDEEAGFFQGSAKGFERPGKVRFDCFNGDVHFFGDLRDGQSFIAAVFKDELAFFRKGFDDAADIFFQEFAIDLRLCELGS